MSASQSILFSASEAFPFIKAGGLADVCGALPKALSACGYDVRLIIPAYDSALEAAGNVQKVSEFVLPHPFARVEVLERAPIDSNPHCYFLRINDLFSQSVSPYGDSEGRPWQDVTYRFAQYSRALARIAMDEAGLFWKPDIAHLNDWHTALAAALIGTQNFRPKIVFTIHNLAYQGISTKAEYDYFGFDQKFWSPEGMEFYGNWSLIKGGIAFADAITTVSPKYALEICTPEFGYGLEGLLKHRNNRLSGVLNGIDEEVWNPAGDLLIERRYDVDSLDRKIDNKRALCRRFNINFDEHTPLVGVVSRLVEQKGIHLLTGALRPLLGNRDCQLVVLGSGDQLLENELLQLAIDFSENAAVILGYDEKLAHLIQAGSDMLVVPSLYEPCGLTQLYAMNYGTLPVVRATGGLDDTVIALEAGNVSEATGFKFEQPTVSALIESMLRGFGEYKTKTHWRTMQENAMHQCFDWKTSAATYSELYSSLR